MRDVFLNLRGHVRIVFSAGPRRPTGSAGAARVDPQTLRFAAPCCCLRRLLPLRISWHDPDQEIGRFRSFFTADELAT
jgi:hypothetical protein